MLVASFVILVTGWLLWVAPFFLQKRSKAPVQTSNPRARWGIALQIVGYSLLWQAQFWMRTPQWWQLAAAILFFLLGALLSWAATPALGRHWRVQAGLSADHELVTSGPYRFVRHPIYASMLCVFIGTGIQVAPWWLFALAAVVFVAGTEIRVHIEDGLLAGRFGEESLSYRRRVRAYIPFVR
jgi:protein-S-isoprenylcysteine O-methyltransferase Ste14